MRDEMVSRLSGTLAILEASQYREDEGEHYRGEFPMWLAGRVTRTDHNFLTGYALVHLALARTSPALPADSRASLDRMLNLARDIPRRFTREDGMCNWYHGKLSGCGIPPDYDWKNGLVLCLCNDFDDTSIAAQLSSLAGHDWAGPDAVDMFIACASPADRAGLGYRSNRRLDQAGVNDGVYQTWRLPAPDAEEVRRKAGVTLPLRMVPPENSVEMVTAANIWTAVALLGGAERARESQDATARFVNELARQAVRAYLDGDATALKVAAPYYPWTPFAPIAFLLHNHCATGGTLLDASTLALIGDALVQARDDGAPDDGTFIARTYWLNCAAWCARAGCLPGGAAAAIGPRWTDVQSHLEPAGTWPDFIFFNEAHIGDYSGRPYSQALMVETMALLLERPIA